MNYYSISYYLFSTVTDLSSFPKSECPYPGMSPINFLYPIGQSPLPEISKLQIRVALVAFYYSRNCIIYAFLISTDIVKLCSEMSYLTGLYFPDLFLPGPKAKMSSFFKVFAGPFEPRNISDP